LKEIGRQKREDMLMTASPEKDLSLA